MRGTGWVGGWIQQYTHHELHRDFILYFILFYCLFFLNSVKEVRNRPYRQAEETPHKLDWDIQEQRNQNKKNILLSRVILGEVQSLGAKCCFFVASLFLLFFALQHKQKKIPYARKKGVIRTRSWTPRATPVSMALTKCRQSFTFYLIKVWDNGPPSSNTVICVLLLYAIKALEL